MSVVSAKEFRGGAVHLETLSKPVAFTIMGLDKIAYRENVDREKGGRQILGHPSLKNG